MAIAFVLVLFMKVDESRADVPPSIGSSLALLKNPTFALAVLGIFVYVGAEVCMGTFLKPTLAGLGLSEEKSALLGPSLFFGCITIGRLIAGVVKVNPHVFFRVSALLGLIGVGLVMSGNQTLALVGVVLGAFGFANIWPMLFSITVEEKPEAASELSGLMCMAISGGAIVPLLMGNLRDGGMTTFSFIVPAVCFAYLLLLSLRSGKKSAA
jgi:fucose permease